MNQSARTVLYAALAAIIFLFVWYANRILLLAFGGLLFGIALHTFAAWIERHSPLGPKLSYTLTIFAICGFLTLLILFLGPRAISQASDIAGVIPHSLGELRVYLEQRQWGQSLVQLADRSMGSAAVEEKITLLAVSFFQGGAGLIVIAVVGFFGALNPKAYHDGFVCLFPAAQRARAEEVLGEVIFTLRWWLLGQLVPMTMLGGCAMIALYLMGVPLAFTLGLFTGIMIFIPYVGALLSTIPAVLVGLEKGYWTALYVLILYLAIHTVEGYFLTPFVQKRAVRVPPVLSVLAQLLFWTATGLLGVALATPMVAVALVLVRTLWLGESVRRRSAAKRAAYQAVEQH